METLVNTVQWVVVHKTELTAIALSVFGVFSLVARITPTQADNKIVDKIYAFIHTLGMTKPQ